MTSYNYMLLGEVILAASYRVSQGAEPAGDRLNVKLFRFVAVI